MKRSTLIQRCFRGKASSNLLEGHSSGLPRHFWEGLFSINQIFDYMGSPHFEGHAIGEGLHRLFVATNNEIRLREFDIHPTQVMGQPMIGGSNVVRHQSQRIYYLYARDQSIEILERLRQLATNDRVKNAAIQLEEPIYFSDMLKFFQSQEWPLKQYETWFELDNGLIFTTSTNVARFLRDYFNPAPDLDGAVLS